MAHSIGFYAAHTYLRIQGVAHTAREKADQLDQPKTTQIEPSNQSNQQSSEQGTAEVEEPKQPVTKKAEEIVDYLAQHLSSLTATAKFNFQKTAARVREDAEDIWAEAQSIRQHMH
jgi:hypothetical protein